MTIQGTPPLAPSRAPSAWHAQALPAIYRALKTSDGGLSAAEAARRLATHGPNRLPEQAGLTPWQILLRQFQSPLIYVLALAAAVSAAVGDLKDAGFIGLVLAVNAAIGGFQEWRAERSSRALQQLLRVRASVQRDGEVSEIDAEGVVPGDVVWLESGNRVPADLRLTMAYGLEVDESLLTGESLAVAKDPSWPGAEATPLADRLNMAHAGSVVVRGRARGVAVATGMGTSVGQLARDVLGVAGGKPPLVERMARFSRAIAVVVLIAAVAVVLIGFLGHGHSLLEMFFFSVALAVSAIPEGLPAALTVALAIATTRMARRGVIVRRLPAVEGLGSCTLIASDKTGTLTCNELTVREVCLPGGEPLEVTGEGYVPEGQFLADGRPLGPGGDRPLQDLALAALLCNEADLHHRDGTWAWRGDPTDIGLLSMARKLGLGREEALARSPQVNQIPFEPEHKYAASYHEVDGSPRVFVKGAPERVLTMCDPACGPATGEDLRATAHAMAGRGFRVLALAEGAVSGGLDPTQAPPEPAGLRFLGFVGMIDPLRPGVSEAVAACHGAGITVWMVTGDHPVTALAIARDLGLADRPDQVVTGTELAQMPPEALREVTRTALVFARVTPRQKLELVEAARRGGHFVAVTGDGVNDAPALRASNIGVAMGKGGTDVAREAAELVVSDDNFATIVSGIEEGRVAYGNVRNVIFLLISTGGAEVVMATLALAAGLPLPLLPVQLLWLNLVTNGIQGVALAFEPGQGDELRRRPRPPGEPVFDRLMIERSVVSGLVMGLGGLGAFWWMLGAGWGVHSARNALLLLFVLYENIHIGIARSETKSAFRLSPLRSPFLLAGALAALLIHVAMLYLPAGHALLSTEPVGVLNWAVLIALALTVLVAMEIHKWSWRVRRCRTPSAAPEGQAP